MSIFDIDTNTDMDAVVDKALKVTHEFLTLFCKSLHTPVFYHEWEKFLDSGYLVAKQQTFEILNIRSVFDTDKMIRFSRLSVKWNPKDNIVDIIVLEPKSPVYIEHLSGPEQFKQKYFRFVTKSGKPIIFYRRNWGARAKNEVLIPCKNMDKVVYIDNF